MSNGIPETDDSKTIDLALEQCQRNISRHRLYSIVMVLLLAACTYAFYLINKTQQLSAQNVVDLMNSGQDRIQSLADILTSKTHLYLTLDALFIIVFGILISIYRFHLVEIARNEHTKMGFWRIRIAARNTDLGFQSEVRQTLTKDAFSFDRTLRPEKGKNIESPVPGHPGSDLATAFLNKILENVHIDFTKKDKTD